MTGMHTFDTLEVGMTWRGPARTLTEAELAWSCMTSGDWHPIHADASFAATTAAGQRMFQGSYGIHLALGMATHLPELGDAVIAALGLNEWNFRAPLFVNDTVHAEVELTGKRETRDGARAVIERRVRLVKSGGGIAHEGQISTLIHRRSTAT
ncbi:MaoC/PaaZ C-terminal domain-containing protein [Pigmentiphaga litoralis]|uniref:MaoC/PaaZ C-terminal domain-containing protein n=1 Tax=Pigmentiphaga litoralis TaxID=516702 RepID=UPI003B4294AA